MGCLGVVSLGVGGGWGGGGGVMGGGGGWVVAGGVGFWTFEGEEDGDEGARTGLAGAGAGEEGHRPQVAAQ